jgi:hypothetical protein
MPLGELTKPSIRQSFTCNRHELYLNAVDDPRGCWGLLCAKYLVDNSSALRPPVFRASQRILHQSSERLLAGLSNRIGMGPSWTEDKT